VTLHYNSFYVSM